MTTEKFKVVFNEVKCEAKKRVCEEHHASARTILNEAVNAAFIERKEEMSPSTSLYVPVSSSSRYEIKLNSNF